MSNKVKQDNKNRRLSQVHICLSCSYAEAAAIACCCSDQIVATGLGLLPAADGGLLVDFIVEGSPAAAAGVKVGDRLVEVNGTSTAAMELK
jgi:C-terminal processing protease CtpA/Prc